MEKFQYCNNNLVGKRKTVEGDEGTSEDTSEAGTNTKKPHLTDGMLIEYLGYIIFLLSFCLTCRHQGIKLSSKEKHYVQFTL